MSYFEACARQGKEKERIEKSSHLHFPTSSREGRKPERRRRRRDLDSRRETEEGLN